jgi:hypothetical protein
MSAILFICANVRFRRTRDDSQSETFIDNGFASLMLAGDSTAKFGQSGSLGGSMPAATAATTVSFPSVEAVEAVEAAAQSDSGPTSFERIVSISSDKRRHHWMRREKVEDDLINASYEKEHYERAMNVALYVPVDLTRHLPSAVLHALLDHYAARVQRRLLSFSDEISSSYTTPRAASGTEIYGREFNTIDYTVTEAAIDAAALGNTATRFKTTLSPRVVKLRLRAVLGAWMAHTDETIPAPALVRIVPSASRESNRFYRVDVVLGLETDAVENRVRVTADVDVQSFRVFPLSSEAL